SARPDDSSRRQRWLAVAGGDVEDAVALLDPGELDQAPADRPRRAVDVLAPPLPTGRRGVPLRALLAAEFGRADRLRLHRNLPRSFAPRILCLRLTTAGARHTRLGATRQEVAKRL